jgi:hypothetical protein
MNSKQKTVIKSLLCNCDNYFFKGRNGLVKLQNIYDDSDLKDIFNAWKNLKEEDKNIFKSSYLDHERDIEEKEPRKYDADYVKNYVIPFFYFYVRSKTQKEIDANKTKLGIPIEVEVLREVVDTINDEIAHLQEPEIELQVEELQQEEVEELSTSVALREDDTSNKLIENIYKCIFASYLNIIFVLYELTDEDIERRISINGVERYVLSERMRKCLKTIFFCIRYILQQYNFYFNFITNRSALPKIVTELLLVYLTLLAIPGGKYILYIICYFIKCLSGLNLNPDIDIISSILELAKSFREEATRIGWQITDFLFILKLFIENVNTLAPTIRDLAPTIRDLAPVITDATAQITDAATSASSLITDAATSASGQIIVAVGASAAAASSEIRDAILETCGFTNNWWDHIRIDERVEHILEDIKNALKDLHDVNERMRTTIAILEANGIDSSYLGQIMRAGQNIFTNAVTNAGASALLNTEQIYDLIMHGNRRIAYGDHGGNGYHSGKRTRKMRKLRKIIKTRKLRKMIKTRKVKKSRKPRKPIKI